MAAPLRHIWLRGDSGEGPTSATDWKHPRARTGAAITRRKTSASCVPRGLTTSASRPAGTTTPARGQNSAFAPSFSHGSTSWCNAGLREGLAVLINIHHFDDFTSNPKEQTPRFLAIWRQIAEHYSKAPAGLALELLNEPKDAATTEVINPIFAEAIRQIRRIDPKRTIFRRAE